LEYFAIDQLFPEWCVFEQFVHFDVFRAFALDGLKSSHPVEVPVNSASEIDEVFDAISYSKGSCCVRMLLNWLGAENFRQGMVQYLKKFSFSNAVTNDLWNTLGEHLNKDVSSMMKSWTSCTGYPVVVVTESAQGDNKTLHLTQHRFLDGGVDMSDPTIWSVPISYLICHPDNTVTEQQLLMTEKQSSVTIPSNIKWIKFNKNQTGFFRVNYQGDSYYSSLVDPIKNKQLTAIDRMTIIEDATTLSKSGLVPIEHVLELFSAYTNEDNYTVLSSVATCLSTVFNLIKCESEQVLEQFSSLARSIFVKHRDDLGWEQQSNESHLRSMKRSLVMANLFKFNDKATIEKALSKFADFQKDPSSLIPDLREVVYSAVAKYGNSDMFQQVWNIYQTSDLNEEKMRVLKGIGLTQNDELLYQTVARVLDGSVLTQDISYLLIGLSQNPKATKILWTYFFNNYAAIRQKFESGLLFGRVIKLFTESAIEPSDVQEIKEQLELIKTKSIQRTVDQVKETITLNSEWSTKVKGNIIAWLSK